MNTFRISLLIVCFPAVLRAQVMIPNAFQVIPPSISTKVERCTDFDQAHLRWINDITMDSAGFLWCAATLDGLARFDGYEARWYREDPSDTLGRARTAFTSVAIDGEGFVWGGSPIGVMRLDPLTGRSKWYMDSPQDSNSAPPGSPPLLVTSEGELWAGTWRSLAKYEQHSASFTFFPYPQRFAPVSGPRSPIRIRISMCELGGYIWVGSQGGGIARFDRDAHTWKVYRHNAADNSGPSSDNVFAVCGDRSGDLWVGSDVGLDRYTPGTNQWRRPDSWGNASVRIPHTWVTGIVEDEYRGIWVSTMGRGIFRLDPKEGYLRQFLHDPADPRSIPFNEVANIRPWRSEGRRQSGRTSSRPPTSIVWVTPGYWGLWRIIIREDPCTRILFNSPEATHPRGVSDLRHDPSGKLWIGIGNEFGAIVQLDPQARTWRSYPGPAGIKDVGRLSDGSIMVSTIRSQVWMRNAIRDTFITVAPDLNADAFLEENDSSLWLGCHDGRSRTFLALLNRRTGLYTIYPHQDTNHVDYMENGISRMCADDSGSIWYGTAGGGLIRFDRSLKTYQRYASRTGSPDALVHNQIFALVPDSGERLWVGTKEGLDLMDRRRGTFEHMRSPNAVNEPVIMGMADDGEGHLWIASLPTVLCFTKASRTFSSIPIPGDFKTPIPLGVTFDPLSRTVAVGLSGGLFTFSIDNPPATLDPPPVVLTSFKVFEKTYPLERDIASVTALTLPPSASFFSFTFAALDYLDPSASQYAYRLEGFDADWVLSGSRRYVSYSNLDPRTYIFRVRGTNSEGRWSDNGAAITITVLPPWYRTFWAYGGYILLAGGLLFITWRFDRRRTALKHVLQLKDIEAKKMQEMDQVKSRFFANISHEFRTPLTLVLGPLDKLIARMRDKESQLDLSMMHRNGLRLLQLINQLLDLSRLDAGKMSLAVRSMDLVALSRALVLSFTSLAERKKIHLIFDPESDEIITYLDQDKYEKILTNLLSNAFKFTGDGGEIRVVLRIVEVPAGPWIEISVADTGMGIGAESIGRIFDRFYQVDSPIGHENGGTGIGLALTKELVELHKGSIDVQSVPGHGSTFTVHLPVGKEPWSEQEIIAGEVAQSPSHHHAPVLPVLEGAAPGIETPHEETGKPVVLIVEDNVDVRCYIRGVLHDLFDIVESGDGNEALKKAHETTVDLVISDVMMPGMDGSTLCSTLKRDDRTSHIPVILLTARATTEGKLEGLDIGADDYMIKPFDARELATRAKNLIELRRTLRAKYSQQVSLGLSKMEITTVDSRFLRSFTEKAERHLSDTKYDTERAAYDMCMSRMQLNRKIHALTGFSTHGLLREFRLQRAAELLRGHAGNVAEVACAVGFNNLSHFARVFRERFGLAPSAYERSGEPAPQQNARTTP